MRLSRLMLVLSVAALVAACTNETEADASKAAPQVMAEAAPQVAEPMTEAVAPMAVAGDDEDPIGTANVLIGMQNGAPYFSQASAGFCAGGACQGGITLDSGDIDLSGFPPGDVLVTVSLDSDASGAGYALPTDPYQAVAIAVIPPGAPPPTPVFGQDNWPSDFDPPVLSSGQLSFVDEEEDTDLYEYSIGLNGPNGRVVMDPKIKNGGVPPAPAPEPLPGQ